MSNFLDMTDMEFEKMLENELPEMPPDDISKEVNPVSTSMKRITWGFGISTVTISLWSLNYILPAIGVVIMMLGFRALHKENKPMALASILSMVLAGYRIAMTIFSSAIFMPQLEKAPLFIIISNVFMLAYVLMTVCLWLGILKIQKKAGVKQGAPSAFMLVVWAIVICAMGNYSGGYEVILLIAILFVILFCIFRLSKTLDEAGYSVETASVRIEDNNMKKLIAIIILVGVTIGILFFQKVPVKWEIMERETAAEVEEVKEKLIGLGYPEYALNDLTNEDILACKDAIEVTTVIKDLHPGEDVKIVGKVNNNPYEYTATDIVVKMGDGKTTWKIFHHFRWNEKTFFCGTEGISIWPAWRMAKDTYRIDEPTGRIFYDKNGTKYEAKVENIETEESVMLIFNEILEDYYAEFSFPYSGENQRGYFTYSVIQSYDDEKWDHITSTIEYLHQKNPLRFPVKSAKQALIDGAYESNNVFDHIQSTGWRSGRDRIDENRPPEKLPPHPEEGISH